jgi:hypothetical protein
MDRSEIDEEPDSVHIISVLFSTNIIFFAVYVIAVMFQYKSPPYFYGYENLQINTSLPGDFVDRRYGFFWVLQFIQSLRYLYIILLGSMIILSQGRIKISHWMRILFEAIVVWFLIFDIVYLIVMWIHSINNNSIAYVENPCHDQLNYCTAYANYLPTICPTNSYDPLFDNKNLNINQTCRIDFYFNIVWFLVDLIGVWGVGTFL